jgi:hypothetical protein
MSALIKIRKKTNRTAIRIFSRIIGVFKKFFIIHALTLSFRSFTIIGDPIGKQGDFPFR